MNVIDWETDAIDWKQLDGWGQVVGSFHGSFPALKLHMLTGIRDATVVRAPEQITVFLRGPVMFVECIVVTFSTPWGVYRFIPADVVA